VLQALDYTLALGGHLYVFVHNNTSESNNAPYTAEKVGVGAKVRNGKVYGIPVKIWDEWVRIAVLMKKSRFLMSRHCQGQMKNRLKGRVNCPMAGGAKVSLSMGVQVGMGSLSLMSQCEP